MPPTIAIALSGGIDSLVTAAILKDRGHELVGLHFLTGFETALASDGTHPPPNIRFADLEEKVHEQLSSMVDQLGIPFHVIDLRSEFKSLVVDYFVDTYQGGKTPNPCLKCNPSIKFGVLLDKAKDYGATHLATGHYARLKTTPDGIVHLLRGVDPVKDQSYFLARLSQSQLKSAFFPLGGLTKDQTRQLAVQKGLKPAATDESQDICFIKNGTYGEFLKQQPGFNSQPGPIEDLRGNRLGSHNGLHLFTIGQRRGINCPASEPYYVVRIDPSRNLLIVGHKKDLPCRTFMADNINWIAPPATDPINILVRVRYRHQAVPATLIPHGRHLAEIVFEESQPAVTPGQGAVFYIADEVLGGGWIQ